MPEYIRPLFCEGKGPFRWAALSGDPADIAATDRAVARDVSRGRGALARWIRLARERVAFQGLPARICWLGYGERARFGLHLNDLVRAGVLKAPIVIGRDHLDTGSVASPNRETEGMRDGSDAIADWPVLNALLNASCGATWVSVHHGGGVGIGYSLHAGMVIVADGTPRGRREARARADVRPGHRRRPPRGRRLSEDAIETAARHRPPAADAADRSTGVMMRIARPALERRVAALVDATPSRIPGARSAAAASGRTSAARGLRDRIGRDNCQYIDVERAATTPERFHRALCLQSPFRRPRRRRSRCTARARRSTRRWRSSTGARTADGGPATFLLDEVLELRTFESFPGLRARPARPASPRSPASGNRFVLTTRYVARAHRLLRDAPPRFEVIHVPPLEPADAARRAWSTAGLPDADDLAAHRPRADRRPRRAYVRAGHADAGTRRATAAAIRSAR